MSEVDCKSCGKPFHKDRVNAVNCKPCRVTLSPYSSRFDCKICGGEDRTPVARIWSEKICKKCRKPKVTHKLSPNILSNNTLTKFVKQGYISPATFFKCVDCGVRATCWEHRDYNKPLDVVPTCQSCNQRRGPGKPLTVGGLLDERRFELWNEKPRVKVKAGTE